MRFLVALSVTMAGLMGCGAALADRVAGIAGLPSRPSATTPTVVAGPALRSGTVSALRADGSQIEIDGKWLLVKPGRTLLLRHGLPVGASALVKGQKLSFTLASTSPGEKALGVVHVP